MSETSKPTSVSLRRCTYCGGDAQPWECEDPDLQYDGRFWFGYAVALLMMAWMVAVLVWWLT